MYSAEKVREMLAEAFDMGGKSSPEFKADDINEIMGRHKVSEAPQIRVDDDFRIYNCAELKKVPEGTEFLHKTLGKCRVVKKQDTKYAEFSNSDLLPSGFNEDSHPWDQPMKLVSVGKE